jgi:PPOX class probable F420-dependent enzyme
MVESSEGVAPYVPTDAAAAFTEERHLAILSTPGSASHGRPRIHSVAVGFTLSDGVVRIITGDGTQKVLNIERSGSATVAQVDGRRWLSLSGRARIRREPEEVSRAVELYAKRYRQPSPNPKRVVIEIIVDDVLGSPGMKR